MMLGHCLKSFSGFPIRCPLEKSVALPMVSWALNDLAPACLNSYFSPVRP